MTATDEHWSAWKRSLGPEGLISYRYLGCSSRASVRDHAVGGLRLRRDLRTSGGLLAAPLGIALLDTAGINVDAIARCAPTRIDVTVFEPARDIDELRILGDLVREGRTQMFTQGRFEDASTGRVIGFGTTSWAVVAPAPPGYVYVDPGPGVADSPDLPPLHEAFGVTRRADGAYELATLSPRVGADALHQGPIQVMLEAAALDVARAAAETDDLFAQHTATTIVQRGKTGPFVTRAEMLAQTGGVVACRSELHDQGADDRLVATGFSFYRKSS